jgi:surfactin synthase thioesterase subunit
MMRPDLTRGATHRLICVPHAGSGPSAFRDLAKAFPEEVEVVAPGLPGHEDRLDEAPLRDIGSLVEYYVELLARENPGPYSVFGQCSGAYVALELARALAARCGSAPARVFVASQTPVSWESGGATADQAPSLEDCIATLIADGELDPELAADPEFMEIFTDTLDADIAVLCSYLETGPHDPIDAPIVALYGTLDDPAIAQAQEGWRHYTTASFTLGTVDSGHLITRAAPEAVVRRILAEL